MPKRRYKIQLVRVSFCFSSYEQPFYFPWILAW